MKRLKYLSKNFTSLKKYFLVDSSHGNRKFSSMKEEDCKNFYNLLKETRVVLIHEDALVNTLQNEMKVKNKAETGLHHEDFKSDTITVPFPVTWFEVVGEEKVTRSVLIHEKAPDVVDIYFYLDLTGVGKASVTDSTVCLYKDVSKSNNNISASDHSFLIVLFNSLQDGEVGALTEDDVIYLPKEKKPHENKARSIKDIIIVTTKKYKKESVKLNRKIDWSHRWEVRGHWRKVNGIGKDREGNYTVEGFTWVLNHERGPEEKELVIKTRYKK